MMYRLVECPHCRRLFTTYASKRTKCVYCHKSVKLDITTVLFESENPYAVIYEKARRQKEDRPGFIRYEGKI